MRHLWFLGVGIVDEVATVLVNAEVGEVDEIVSNNLWIICVFLRGKPVVIIIKILSLYLNSKVICHLMM